VKGEGLDYWSCEDCQQPTPPAEVSLPGQPTQENTRLYDSFAFQFLHVFLWNFALKHIK
jgi:hypothetical protein